MKQSSIHVRSLAINASNISTETIDGEPHVIVRGVVPLVDDVVMNGGLYPAEEINNSYGSIEGNLMPLSHPKVDGNFVSANDARAINKFHVGAWAVNVRKEAGRVVLDMRVNRRFAESSEQGKRLLQRLDDMAANKNVDPIHVSTGLLTNKESATGESKGKKYRWIARNMRFNHVAILLDEPGAATPDEGVGIFVNSDGQPSDIERADLVDASNCMREGWWTRTKFFLSNTAEYAFDEIQRAISDKLSEIFPSSDWLWPESVWPDTFVYRRDEKYFKQKYIIDDDGKAVFVGEPAEVVRTPPEFKEIKTNGETDPMKDLIINALKAKGKPTDGKTDAELMDAYNQMLKEGQPGTPSGQSQAINTDAITAAVNAAIQPLHDKIGSLEKVVNANADKELADKRAAVKAKFGLEDVAVNALQGDALDGLYAKCHTTAGLNGGFQSNSDEDDQWKDYDLNAGMTEEKK